MKTLKVIVLISSFTFFSCGKDDGRTCINCTQAQTPDFQVCEEANGTASVNGQNTGVSYDEYIAGLETEGASCGN